MSSTRGSTTAGTGGTYYAANKASVSFNPLNWWTSYEVTGLGVVQRPGWTDAGGNGWLVVHEVMHGRSNFVVALGSGDLGIYRCRHGSTRDLCPLHYFADQPGRRYDAFCRA